MDTNALRPETAKAPAHILIVDDEEKNRELLVDSLVVRGYHVSEAENGELALKLVRENPPDVILLDAVMPKMDGFETCRWLKKETQNAMIPVLMITSLTNREDRLRGIESGVNDFLNKPIDLEDVLLRVRNAVQTKRLFDELQQSLAQVKKLEVIRDNFTQMLVSDFRAPVRSALETLNHLASAAGKDAGAKTELVEDALLSLSELDEKVNSLRDITRLQAGELPVQPVSCDLASVVRAATTPAHSGAVSSAVQVDAPREPVRALCDLELTTRIISSLVSHALATSESHDGKSPLVTIVLGLKEQTPLVTVANQGAGLSFVAQQKIFDTLHDAGGDKPQLNTRLAFCKLAVEAQGGQIGVESQLDVGTRFWFTLPPAERSRKT